MPGGKVYIYDDVDVIWHDFDDDVDVDVDGVDDDDIDGVDDDVDEVWHGVEEEAVSGNTRPKQPLYWLLHFDHSISLTIVYEDNDWVMNMLIMMIGISL